MRKGTKIAGAGLAVALLAGCGGNLPGDPVKPGIGVECQTNVTPDGAPIESLLEMSGVSEVVADNHAEAANSVRGAESTLQYIGAIVCKTPGQKITSVAIDRQDTTSIHTTSQVGGVNMQIGKDFVIHDPNDPSLAAYSGLMGIVFANQIRQ